MRHGKTQGLSGSREISVELGLAKTTTGKCSFPGLFENPQRSKCETLVLHSDCEVRYVQSLPPFLVSSSLLNILFVLSIITAARPPKCPPYPRNAWAHRLSTIICATPCRISVHQMDHSSTNVGFCSITSSSLLQLLFNFSWRLSWFSWCHYYEMSLLWEVLSNLR